jgi:dipeptidyl aminopeptidase/acylaminoacyl peptidase
VRWSISRSEPVSGARWAPSGYRIAYLTGPRTGFEVPPGSAPARQQLRVVAGDGTGDRLFDGRTAPAPPAWRPGPRHVLAYAKPDGSVAIADADTGARLGRSAPGEAPAELAWSGDGRRLVVRGDRTLRVLDGRGRLLAAIPLTAGEPSTSSRAAPPPAPSLPAAVPGAARTVAFRGRGHELALIRGGPDGRASEVVLVRAERSPGVPRRLFAGPGALGDLAWSPDGRWLLVSWPSANQWVFIRATSAPKVRAVPDISREFDPGGGRELPGRVEWCCAVR